MRTTNDTAAVQVSASSILDPAFEYKNSASTDVAQTFARAGLTVDRAEQVYRKLVLNGFHPELARQQANLA